MFIDRDHRVPSLPAEIILLCDTDAILFKAIVKRHSSELDAIIADELGYLNYHNQRRISSGPLVNYFQFQFFSLSEGRLYRITRFDTLEDAAKYLFSEPYMERGAVLVCPSSWNSTQFNKTNESAASMVRSAKALIRSTLGFNCVTIFFNDALKIRCQDAAYNEWADDMADFGGNGIVGKSLVMRVEGSTRSLLDIKHGRHPKWWRLPHEEQLELIFSFFHRKLPLYIDYSDGITLKFEQEYKLLTALFYCFNKKEGGSQIAATDRFLFSIGGITVAEGHILGAPGVAIEPGKLCQGEVLILLEKAAVVGSRDHFVARRMDGASIGVGMIVSCG